MLELYAYAPAFDLPSYDPHCLAVQSLLNLLGVEWVLVICSTPSASPTGVLPVLKEGLQYVSGLFSIIEHLEKKGLKLVADPDNNNALKHIEIGYYLDDKLADILAYYRYIDEANYLGSTRPQLAQFLSVTSRYSLPGKLRERAQNRLQAYHECLEVEAEKRKKIQFTRLSLGYLQKIQDDKALTTLEAKMMEITKTISKDVAEKLGDQDYIFGKSIHTLDLVIASHLAHLLRPQLPNCRAADYIIMNHPQLLAYYERVLKISQKSTQLSVQSETSWLNLLLDAWRSKFSITREKEKIKTQEELELARNRAYSIIGATITFTFYVIYHGLVPLQEDQSWEETLDTLEEEDDM